jgi:hypothetical protein
MSKPNRNRRAVKMRKPKTADESKYDLTVPLTALEDIVLLVGEPNTETDHRVKMIAERAIAKAYGR